MQKKRKICVATGTRAEYGLLYWLMRKIQSDPAMILQTLVTGAHLSPAHGLTYKTIEADGFPIDCKVDMRLTDDSPRGIAHSLGTGIGGFADALASLMPDILVILGDRYEMLGIAQAAMLSRIPIAHIHGGETTEGAIDEAIRHAITKMSHFHFVTAEDYRRRVIQLGEDPCKVFTAGSPGVENISRLQFQNRDEVEKSIGMKLGEKNLLVTYHPVTLNKQSPALAMEELLSALDKFPEAKIVFTKPNADAENAVISEKIDQYVGRNPARSIAHASLGQLRYLSLARLVDAVVGNSSSGIIEIPALGKPTVNIGDRQRGRLASGSVLHCAEERDAIAGAIRAALAPDFQKKLPQMVSPYVSGDVSGRIHEQLGKVDLENILMKKFYDIQIGSV